MRNFNFGTPTPIPCRLSDYPGFTARVRVAGTINAETDDEMRGQPLKMTCLTLLNETLAGYGDKLRKDDIERLPQELCRTLSDKLTDRSGISCRVNIVSMSFDNETQKIIDDFDRAAKMADPEYAAKKIAEAEMEAREKLERQKQENALKLSADDGRSINGDCVPPLRSMPEWMPMGKNISGEEVFDGGYAGRLGEVMPTQFIMPQAMQPDTVDLKDIIAMKQTAIEAPTAPEAPSMPNYDAQWDKIRESIPPIPQPVTGIMANNRPKFCKYCGKPLPDTGNFCGECGKPIM